MAVQDLITEIYNSIPMGMFELEYDYEINPHNIDLRLYGANLTGAKTIAGIINEFDFAGVVETAVEIPSKSEIEYAFTGHKFVRVLIEVDRNVARGEKDHFFFNDAGRMI